MHINSPWTWAIIHVIIYFYVLENYENIICQNCYMFLWIPCMLNTVHWWRCFPHITWPRNHIYTAKWARPPRKDKWDRLVGQLFGLSHYAHVISTQWVNIHNILYQYAFNIHFLFWLKEQKFGYGSCKLYRDNSFYLQSIMKTTTKDNIQDHDTW